jgi:hypothetical protein
MEESMNQTPLPGEASKERGCNCGKNKKKFKEQDLPDQGGFFKKKMSMVQNFATSLTSRGLGNKKINRATKQLRVLSCIGNEHMNGELPPCEHLLPSEVEGGEGKKYCGACGCGDRKGTWLIADSNEYSKLDYPKVTCPLQMPGFTNYRPSTPEEAEEPETRKHYIENISYKEMERTPVTLPEMTEEQKKAMEESQKRMAEAQKRKIEEMKKKKKEENK